jgi:DNA-binding IclR family transcriptional regulator
MTVVKLESTSERTNYQIRALDRGLDILEAFSIQSPELSIKDIAARTGLPKPTVIRLLSVLHERGYVERLADSEGYRLGVRTLEISSIFLQTTSVEVEARPIMARLAHATAQTANLGILDDYQVVHIAVVAPERPVRFWASIGKREDAYVSGLGKALLTGLSPDQLEHYLTLPRPALTPYTITDADELRRELRLTSERGWAVDRQESNIGVACVAAPVRDASGAIVAAISISGLQSEFEAGSTLETFAEHVRTAADKTSTRLGWKPDPA